MNRAKSEHLNPRHEIQGTNYLVKNKIKYKIKTLPTVLTMSILFSKHRSTLSAEVFINVCEAVMLTLPVRDRIFIVAIATNPSDAT